MATLLSEKHKTRLYLFGLLGPAAIIVLAVVAYPFFYNIFLSLSNSNIYHIKDWEIIGFDQYALVFTEPLFWEILLKTIIWTTVNVVFHVGIGVLLAVILHNKLIKGKPFWRIALIIPWALPQYITALTWRGMFNYEYGAINLMLSKFLGMSPIEWLSSPTEAFIAVILTNIWLGFPFMMVVALGGLQSIPQELYEAADVDGASGWKQFWNITVPMLKPVMVPAITLGIVWTFNNINVVWLVSNTGEPNDQTHILVSYVYKAAFSMYRFGWAAAFSMIIFMILFIFSKAFLNQSDVMEEGKKGLVSTLLAPLKALFESVWTGISRILDSIGRTLKKVVGLTESSSANPRVSKYLSMVSGYGVLALFTFIALYPVTRIITISLRPGDRLLSTSLAFIPEDASLANYIELLSNTPYLRWLFNSLMVAFVVTVTGVALASTAGYALSRYKFMGKKAFLEGLLVTQMFPATMLLLPLYIVLIRLQLINSYLGIIVIYTATALPFCIWQMKGYYDTIPIALEEAARIDGCSPWQTFLQVILPLAAPALVITALFSFMTAWNEYVVAAQVLQDVDIFTMPVGLKMFQGQMQTQWGLYAAGSLLVSIPVIVLFLALSRYLISGLTLGSVKG